MSCVQEVDTKSNDEIKENDIGSLRKSVSFDLSLDNFTQLVYSER